jgi:hypothetical protein
MGTMGTLLREPGESHSRHAVGNSVGLSVVRIRGFPNVIDKGVVLVTPVVGRDVAGEEEGGTSFLERCRQILSKQRLV